MARRIIAGGTGFIGKHLAEHWKNQGHTVAIISRNTTKIEQIFGETVEAIDWSMMGQRGKDLVQNAELIINLSGSNIGEHRWSARKKLDLIESRVFPTLLLSKICSELGASAPALFNASAIGVYGLQPPLTEQLPKAFDESTEIDFQHATDFLSEIARKWECATNAAFNADVRVVNLRFGVVLAKHEGALKKILAPFYWGLGGSMGSGHQPFSWVALPDLLRAIDFIFDHSNLSGPINIVAPHAVSQKQLANELGKYLHRPTLLPLPGFIIKLLFGQMGDELLLRGQHVYPKKLLDTGFEFQYSTLPQALVL